MAESRQIPVAGNFRKRKENASEISFSDFSNPWTFYALFSRDDLTVATWLIEQGLLGRSRPCERADCDGDMRLARRSGRPLGYTLRCNRSRDHEVSIMKYSFFERSKLDVRDIMQLIKTYLEGLSLGMTSRYAGVSYTGTAVDWGSFIRELMKEYFHVRLSQKKMSGIVEIDESLFGRRVKFHRGDPNKGLKVWVFGMVERSTNSLILYPVKDRTADTLIPLIERHVEKGSTIYSDGFSAYFHLNDMGYRHFTVIHKYSFKKTYKNAETGDIEVVHTNRIEGAWKHAKDYFRKMSGTKASQWEGHMAEIMWRSVAKANVYTEFFNLLKSVYTLSGPPNLTYPTPLFDSWEGAFSQQDMVHPVVSDAGSTDSDVLQLEAADAVLANESDSLEDDARVPSTRVCQTVPQTVPESEMNVTDSTTASRQPVKKKTVEKMNFIRDIMSDTSASSEDNITLSPKTSTPKPVKCTKKSGDRQRMRHEHVCCPIGFQETKKESNKKQASATPRNPYSHENYVWGAEFSSDEDFALPKPKLRTSTKASKGKKRAGKK